MQCTRRFLLYILLFIKRWHSKETLQAKLLSRHCVLRECRKDEHGGFSSVSHSSSFEIWKSHWIFHRRRRTKMRHFNQQFFAILFPKIPFRQQDTQFNFNWTQISILFNFKSRWIYLTSPFAVFCAHLVTRGVSREVLLVRSRTKWIFRWRRRATCLSFN